MKATLVSLTQPVPDLQAQGVKTAEDFIAYAARVSNPSNQLNTASAPRLLRFLIASKHWSPFEMANMCVLVETSRAISAQVLRHWSLSPQEFSQRYASAADLGFELSEARVKGATNRQGSVATEDAVLREKWDALQRNIQQVAAGAYESALEWGIAPELARMVLPLSTRTRMYLNASVRDWIHYLDQRTKPDAQREHRDMALAIKAIFDAQFPTVAAAVETERLHAEGIAEIVGLSVRLFNEVAMPLELNGALFAALQKAGLIKTEPSKEAKAVNPQEVA